jgi:GNAT superfamily N-acetyltransferase
MFNHGFTLLISAGLALFRFSVLRKLYSILLYPFRKGEALAKTGVIAAELLAVAVDPGEHGKGHGKRLIQTLEASLRQWGVREYRALTNIADAESNAFYRATGFIPAGAVRHHALTLQAYRKMIGQQEPHGIADD